MSEIVYRGTLTKEKLKELTEKHLEYRGEDSAFNPSKNPNVISLIRQNDGNWKGFTQKFGKLIESREVKPEDALLKLITHE